MSCSLLKRSVLVAALSASSPHLAFAQWPWVDYGLPAEERQQEKEARDKAAREPLADRMAKERAAEEEVAKQIAAEKAAELQERQRAIDEGTRLGRIEATKNCYLSTNGHEPAFGDCVRDHVQ